MEEKNSEENFKIEDIEKKDEIIEEILELQKTFLILSDKCIKIQEENKNNESEIEILEEYISNIEYRINENKNS